MSKQRCNGCDRRVRLGGGIGDLWSFETGSTDGLTLELADGSEHFLCYDCIEGLPDDEEVTRGHVEALPGDVED
ncbi:DUF7561 family protein [Halobaculum magnesiiphilum]|uniref:Small CPxCG-related zinc finger protein n=1 Tax=Halobaculum magnesiiphilum TaxID=1017351 RepID=A0A8T8W8X5_9EURY|nr:hypothetical protein [Halobaculum magnesiiphilum]QZP36299.1 hypothetical protein K6T50_08075 [Halobaculum magnesiiphilum]